MEDNETRTKSRDKYWFVLIWFLFTGIFLITGTYAWFTTNNIVKIDFFDIQIRTDGGITISSDAIDWKTNLTNEDLANAYKSYPSSINQIPYNLKPVSTAGLVDGVGLLYMYTGTIVPQGELQYLQAYRASEKREYGEEAVGHFIAFDVFFKSSSMRTIYLAKTSSVLPKEDEESKGIENSARVAFVVEGNTSSSNVTTAQRLRNASNGTVHIWEPNYDTHTEKGIENANYLFGYNIKEINENRIEYDGVINPISVERNILANNATQKNYPNVFKRVKIEAATKKNNTTNQRIFTIQPGITKVRIYMWIEGQDVDSETNAANGSMKYKLDFTINN